MKKKLNKLEAGSDQGHNIGVSVSQPMSRGQWERRLQTDIRMAKRALIEALSSNKASSSSTLLLAESNSNLSSENSIFYNSNTNKPTTQSMCFSLACESKNKNQRT